MIDSRLLSALCILVTGAKTLREYTAICFDVVPRNEQAVKLYHKLGFDCLSLITLRKQLYDDRRDKTADVLGLKFKI